KGRLITGLAVASNGDIYTAHSDPRIGKNNNNTALCIDTDGGVLTRLIAPDYSQSEDLVVGLPRSRENHAPNGIVFGPDGWLYLSIGGNTNYGAPSTFFSDRPEVNLTAGVVRYNLSVS